MIPKEITDKRLKKLSRKKKSSLDIVLPVIALAFSILALLLTLLVQVLK